MVGAGQSPGEGLGNGRATVLRFAQEGAKVLAVDNNLSSAEETVAIARQAGGECVALEADVAVEATLVAMAEAARRRWGRVDVLHYNVGVSIAGGDAPLDEITETAFDRIATINLRGAIMTCNVLPLMRAQRARVCGIENAAAMVDGEPTGAVVAGRPRRVTAGSGTELRCRGWRQEGLLRQSENVLTVGEDGEGNA